MLIIILILTVLILSVCLARMKAKIETFTHKPSHIHQTQELKLTQNEAYNTTVSIPVENNEDSDQLYATPTVVREHLMRIKNPAQLTTEEYYYVI